MLILSCWYSSLNLARRAEQRWQMEKQAVDNTCMSELCAHQHYCGRLLGRSPRPRLQGMLKSGQCECLKGTDLFKKATDVVF
jgi:hypothetical protein